MESALVAHELATRTAPDRYVAESPAAVLQAELLAREEELRRARGAGEEQLTAEPGVYVVISGRSGRAASS